MSKQQSLLEQILEKGIEAIKKPFIMARVKRAFESAKDSIEEQLMDQEAALNNARQALVDAAKNEENLKGAIQRLIDLRTKIKDLENAQEALEVEKQKLLD